MKKILIASTITLAAASVSYAQVSVLAVARLDATYHLTNMDCPVPGLESTRVATSLAQTRDSDIPRGCYVVDRDNNVVVIHWFEDDPKYPRRTRIPLDAFSVR